MGTNFYWKSKPDGADGMDPEHHIGKRSAAGRWCWDCGLTLCEGGIDGIHQSRFGWHAACPKCGAVPVPEGLDSGSSAVELGFAQPRTKKPTGVRSCASFTWAQDAAAVRQRCEENSRKKVIVDEYGRKMTGREFLEMLAANCPVQRGLPEVQGPASRPRYEGRLAPHGALCGVQEGQSMKKRCVNGTKPTVKPAKGGCGRITLKLTRAELDLIREVFTRDDYVPCVEQEMTGKLDTALTLSITKKLRAVEHAAEARVEGSYDGEDEEGPAA